MMLPDIFLVWYYQKDFLKKNTTTKEIFYSNSIVFNKSCHLRRSAMVKQSEKLTYKAITK